MLYYCLARYLLRWTQYQTQLGVSKRKIEVFFSYFLTFYIGHVEKSYRLEKASQYYQNCQDQAPQHSLFSIIKKEIVKLSDFVKNFVCHFSRSNLVVLLIKMLFPKSNVI